MKKHTILAALGTALLLSSCNSAFSSHWSAKMLIRSTSSYSSSMSFEEFKGLMVFNMKCKNDTYNTLTYDLSLVEGKFNISYAHTEDEITTLCTIEGTDMKEGYVHLPEEGQFYVLLESEETSKSGNFKFEMKSFSDFLVV